MKQNQPKSSIQQPISKPKPPSPEMIEEGSVCRQDIQVERSMNLVFDIETDGSTSIMLLPSTAWLSTISTLRRHWHTMIRAIKNQFQEVCKDSRMRIVLLVTTLSLTTYLLFASFTAGLKPCSCGRYFLLVAAISRRHDVS